MLTPRLGAHESIGGGLHLSIERGLAAGCDLLQVFTKSNHQWDGKEYTREELEQLFVRSEQTQIPIVASHASYLINIASPDPGLRQKSATALEDELRRCELLRIPNLVFHPGSHVGSGEETGLRQIAESLNLVLARKPDSPVTLCLECTAGQGTNLGYRFEQLGSIIEWVEQHNRLGACLDTCHMFAAGYPLADPEGFRDSMQQFDQAVGFERLRLVHLNDSVGRLGSRMDRHAHIGEGEISLEGFRNLLQDERFRRVPMVLETPKSEDLIEDLVNLLLLRSLAE